MLSSKSRAGWLRGRFWRKRLTWWVIGLVALLALIVAGSYGFYLWQVYRSYKLGRDLYQVEGGFLAFKARYEEVREEILGDEDQYWNDIYNRRFVNPSVAGHNLGFHSVEPAPLPAPGVTRVLCVGTSTVWESFPDPLREELQRIAPGRFEVVDAGLPGSSITNLFMNYALIWRQLEPAVVIIEYNLDSLPRHRVTPFAIHPHYDAVVGPEYAFHRIMGFGPGLPVRRLLNALGRADAPQEDDLLGFRVLLESLVLMVEASGAQPILLTQQPTLSDGDLRGDYSPGRLQSFEAHYGSMFWGYTLEGAVAAIDAQNEIIRELAAALEVPLVDVVGAIPREDRYYTDATHLADPGSAIVAEALLERMISDGLVPLGEHPEP
jgi:hypothetical protein